METILRFGRVLDAQNLADSTDSFTGSFAHRTLLAVASTGIAMREVPVSILSEGRIDCAEMLHRWFTHEPSHTR